MENSLSYSLCLRCEPSSAVEQLPPSRNQHRSGWHFHPPSTQRQGHKKNGTLKLNRNHYRCHSWAALGGKLVSLLLLMNWAPPLHGACAWCDLFVAEGMFDDSIAILPLVMCGPINVGQLLSSGHTTNRQLKISFIYTLVVPSVCNLEGTLSPNVAVNGDCDVDDGDHHRAIIMLWAVCDDNVHFSRHCFCTIRYWRGLVIDYEWSCNK